MKWLQSVLDRLEGKKTFLLAVAIAIAWFVRVFLLDDASAVIVLGGTSMGFFLAGLAALITGGKFGDAKKTTAKNGA